MEYHPGTIKSMNAWTPAIKYCIPTVHSKLLQFFLIVGQSERKYTASAHSHSRSTPGFCLSCASICKLASCD